MSYTSATAILIQNPAFPQTSTEIAFSDTVATIESHIRRVDSRINATIAKRYSVPIVPTPEPLDMIAEDLVSFYSTRSFYAQDNQNSTEHLEDFLTPEAQNAFDMLNDIRNGDLCLISASTGSAIEENTEIIDQQIEDANENYTAIFDVDGTLNQKVDQDRLNDIADGR